MACGSLRWFFLTDMVPTETIRPQPLSYIAFSTATSAARAAPSSGFDE
jgi:hypothetical protein